MAPCQVSASTHRQERRGDPGHEPGMLERPDRNERRVGRPLRSITFRVAPERVRRASARDYHLSPAASETAMVASSDTATDRRTIFDFIASLADVDHLTLPTERPAPPCPSETNVVPAIKVARARARRHAPVVPVGPPGWASGRTHRPGSVRQSGRRRRRRRIWAQAVRGRASRRPRRSRHRPR